ncbi:MAG: methyltransferase type 12 [Blastopirellula sp.]|nr:MAG: methyltransferase type 12 [Blastopirellula sp.]
MEAGQAVYSTRTLKFYDLFVLGISNRWIWKCPTHYLREHFARHATSNHLDVGVGTGYFLDKVKFKESNPRIGLLDLNRNCLDVAAKRIERYQPTIFQADLFQPLEIDCEPFQSISINYVLHCLPGNFESKSIVFKHLKPWIATGGVIFGSTILHPEVPRGVMARQLMKVYNQKGIFSNTEDSLTRLHQALDDHFSDVKIETKGCVALFSAKVN